MLNSETNMTNFWPNYTFTYFVDLLSTKVENDSSVLPLQ